MSDKRRTFAVIDGNSLMHRAFHAVPPTMNAPDGRPTNAIFGFLNMFLKMIDAFNPDGVVVAFDKGKPRVRMEMLPQYKAQRPPMDPDLHAQFPMIKELLTALNVPILQSEGWEGDDILGTMARLGEQAGCDMLLVTGDRDMYQLVTEHVNVVSTRKGLSDVAIMTPESVDDLYHGITPALVPDFYGLKGDTSDNIPGVPGIGPKSVLRILAARRVQKLGMPELKRIGVVLKRAQYFITCNGRAPAHANRAEIANALLDPKAFSVGVQQLSLDEFVPKALPDAAPAVHQLTAHGVAAPAAARMVREEALTCLTRRM